MTPGQAYDWLAPKLSHGERQALDVIYAAIPASLPAAEDARDAARYRWLRTPNAGRETWVTTAREGYPAVLLEEGKLDCAIDAAMSQDSKGEGKC